MRRFLLTAVALLAGSTCASAHFVFLVPDAASRSVKAIFSDTLKPDDRVSIEKIENTRLFALDASGKESTLKWSLDKVGAFGKIEGLGDGAVVVAGVTDFGILQRGEGKPFWLKYYAKTCIGNWQAAEKAKLGDRVPIELMPIVEAGKVRFLALVAGKPAAKMEISVYAPGKDKVQDLVTDEHGLSAEFAEAGQYGARFKHTEAKSGEDKGKKYEEVRHYATLVVDFAPAK
jgi:uncharacterized GH25 family protein